MDKKFLKTATFLIMFTVFLVFLIINFQQVWGLFIILNNVLMPFYIGLIFAFIINMPYNFFADKAFIGLENKSNFCKKMRKPLALITANIVVLSVIAIFMILLVPQLIDSANELGRNFANYAQEFQDFIILNLDKYFGVKLDSNNDIFNLINTIVKQVTGGEINTLIKSIATTLTPSVLDATLGVTVTILNIGLGFVVSIYLIGCKEKLISQLKKICYAFLKVKKADKIMEVGTLSNDIFGKFVYGKIIDSIIMGILCFVGMSILRLDYSLLISVIIGVTNVVPVFGPFFGAVPGVFILLIIDPIQAIQFLIFILILQQIDGNFIGPKILGNTIGISGFWIMTSVIIGGGLFGFMGMLLAVPLFSTFYVLLGKNVRKRLIEKDKYKDFENEKFTDIIDDNPKNKENKIVRKIKVKVSHMKKDNEENNEKK